MGAVRSALHAACAQLRADAEAYRKSAWPAEPTQLPSGAITTKAVERAVDAHGAEVHACYEEALALWDKLGGLLTLHFVVDAQGAVLAVYEPRNDTGVPALGCCVAAAARGWQLPRAPAGQVVVLAHTFRFRFQATKYCINSFPTPIGVTYGNRCD